ncbi:MAG: succinylglutamate desuccinylase/aspartoacylase family protein [Proteobacteria bacterium]|nr:succinylglutamate desuccinylase/aspartoacylase family protein [Pseudomonadota bacterium]MBU1389436.1 succinylglutamate desuccinylase/aspartoacylase family protein [Pseudomonadota bacterium]MBU1541256.1 succinylglutamate desuccinylase/aspartoacylase family protein [Pseudomonadota bacterium]MBU2479520.1 succinylglutamate desuccinylase/aspartoacylase family protein [Pseudomonadota bacterium]
MLCYFTYGRLFFLTGLFLLIACCCAFAGPKSHIVYFEGEENELHVYRINGTHPGKTLLIIGGIQGDEPGGFLAADFFADFLLEKGNLIVVPRANFMSIVKQERKINQDMNRKFLNDDIPNYESKVVNVLKTLICESDCFINLHEGSGIYSSEWKSEDKNPQRFGQSIIADDSVLISSNGQKTVNLEEIAEAVIQKINQQISDPEYHFHFNNHKTMHPDSIHKEQLRSATYYAYKVCQIPAFGIESAKSLPLEQKVRQHIYAINGFLEILDIVPQNPAIDLKKPEMQYMIVSVNDAIPVVVGRMQHLKIHKGDTIKVHDVVANYERGLSVDVIGLGNTFNDMKNKLVVNESTRIEAKKDFYKCGSIFLDVQSGPSEKKQILQVSDSSDIQALRYKLKINGTPVIVDDNEKVQIKKGDKLIIEDVLSGKIDPSKYIVNFKGFVGNIQNNSGEDRGYVIDTAKDVLMRQYSLDKKGLQYQVLTTLNGKTVGKIFVNIQSQSSKEMQGEQKKQ